jgi:hypothetical protein
MKCHIPVLWGLGILLALAGCGGGGGGSNGGGSGGGTGLGPSAATDWLVGGCSVGAANGRVSYQVAWPSGAPGESQVLQVVNSAGSVIRTEAFNRGPSEISVNALPAGIYELRAQAYSGPNGTGTLLGTMRKMVDVCTSSTFIVAPSSSAPTQVAAWPPSPTISTLQTVRIVPEARTGTGLPAFSLSNPSFTAVGSGTVSAQGVVQPSGAGTVAVTGALGAFSGVSNVKVELFSARRSKWTVLVFLNAANDLYSASPLNMNQMEEVAGNPDVRFVVQWKQTQAIFPGSTFDGVRRYLVQPDATSAIRSQVLQTDLRGPGGQPLDMGSPTVLNDFIKWGKTNFPADRYALVMWNHGNGWRRSVDEGLTRGYSYDDQSGNSIDIWETDQAMGTETFDIIAWDTSLMQMIEVAYELRNSAKFIVGSEESPPADGYPYDDVFRPFRDNPDADTRTLSKAFVDGMLNHPPYFTRKITQSVLDSTRLGEVAAAADALAGELIANSAAIAAPLATIRSQTQAYSQTSLRWYRDMKDFCLRLEASGAIPASVQTAARNLRLKVEAAVVWEGSNAQSPNSHGLSFDMSPGSVFAGVQSDYSKMDWAAATRWDEFLLQSPAP